MTGGLCLRCGAEKQSAWIPCPSCDFQPTSPIDQARHYLVSERLNDTNERARLKRAIAAQGSLGLDEDEVANLAAELGGESLFGVAMFGLMVGLVPLSVVVVLLLLLICLLFGF